MAHNKVLPNYRFETRALEREGREIDIQVTHETQEQYEERRKRSIPPLMNRSKGI